MPEPIVFISHSTVKEGGLEAFHEISETTFAVMEAEKPGTVLHWGYLDSEGTVASFIHVFPDADAMDAHMEGASERVARANQFIETYSFEIFGEPSKRTMDMLRRAPGVEVSIRPASIGGYIRLGA